MIWRTLKKFLEFWKCLFLFSRVNILTCTKKSFFKIYQSPLIFSSCTAWSLLSRLFLQMASQRPSFPILSHSQVPLQLVPRAYWPTRSLYHKAALSSTQNITNWVSQSFESIQEYALYITGIPIWFHFMHSSTRHKHTLWNHSGVTSWMIPLPSSILTLLSCPPLTPSSPVFSLPYLAADMFPFLNSSGRLFWASPLGLT